MLKYWENSVTPAAMPAGVRVPDELRIGKLSIRPATVLAPMAGITDTVFRQFIRKLGGCGLVMTEFTSADGLLRAKKKSKFKYLHFNEDEHPLSAQLFGSDPAVLAGAARNIEDLGFDLVDLNLGCPAKKVVKGNGGSGLLRDLPLIRRIFTAVRAAVTIPFTVKFRLGWNDDEIVCLELARMAEECGLDAIALHARTREQGYSGEARWEWIEAVRQVVKLPLIGNGDIRTPEDAANLVAQTGCDGVMVGRAAAWNPWIFRQIAEHTATGRYQQPTEADRYRMILTYFEMLVYREMPGALGKMKQFAAWFTHGVRNGAALRRAVFDAKSEQAVLDGVQRFFAPLVEAERGPAATAAAATPEGAAPGAQLPS